MTTAIRGEPSEVFSDSGDLVVSSGIVPLLGATLSSVTTLARPCLIAHPFDCRGRQLRVAYQGKRKRALIGAGRQVTQVTSPGAMQIISLKSSTYEIIDVSTLLILAWRESTSRIEMSDFCGFPVEIVIFLRKPMENHVLYRLPQT